MTRDLDPSPLSYSVYAIRGDRETLVALCASARVALREVAGNDSYVIRHRSSSRRTVWHEGAEMTSAAETEDALAIIRRRLELISGA